MRLNSLQISTDSRRFYLALGSLVLAAWGLLAAWQRSAYAELLSHEAVGHTGIPPTWRLAAFLLSWFLMTVAMMLPGSLPLLNGYVHPVRPHMSSGWLAGLIILGYLSPWAFIGLLVYLGDGFLHRIAGHAAPLAAFSHLILPVVALIAGLYQITPLKRSSMRICRPAHAHFLPGGVEKMSRIWALKRGLRLGIFCVASCWSLMLLMYAVGHNRLDWMLALGGIMAAERLAPWGQRLAWLVGIALIVLAAVWVLIVPPGGHSHP